MTNSAINKIDEYLVTVKTGRKAVELQYKDFPIEQIISALAIYGGVIAMLEDIRAEVAKNDAN